MLEYLAYRLYNLLTPMSYRVRAGRGHLPHRTRTTGVTRFGFLIEDIDDVADRNKRERAEGRLAAGQRPPSSTRAATGARRCSSS